MMRTLAVFATVSSLALSAALAQSPPTAPAPTAPAVSQSGATGTIKSDREVSSTVNTSSAATPSATVAVQKSDEWLASQFKGIEVVGPDDAKIGKVSDVLFDRGGSIKAVIVGVGGFLGIGSKDVALSFGSFDVVTGKNNETEKLRLSMTKDQLASAAEFKPYEPPRSTESIGLRPNSPAAPAPRPQN